MSEIDSPPNLPNLESADLGGQGPSRYVVGIDLGTTNCAVSFVDSTQPDWCVETFAVPQLIAPGQVEARETLPSFLYQAGGQEFPPESLRLPWSDEETTLAVGVFAREQGKLVPGRVIESAKSWLCHPGVDRTSALLPWHGAEDVEKLSPVQASAAYLDHVRRAWNQAHPLEPLESQDVVLTLPASFDEVARELTIEAAKLAGLPRVVLIEEPQAAFYAWIHAHSENWNELVSPGQNILVCDVGGGTSDFTLIRVRSHPEDEVQFHRIAVGDHLILGGDNLDLALAHHLEEKLARGGKLEPRRWGSLVRLCRHAKEVLLGENPPEQYSLSLPGSGAKLIGGGVTVELTRNEVRDLIVEGFFPEVGLSERPRKKGSGFQEFGLPYAADAAITRYLGAFLQDHCEAGNHLGEEGSCRPDVILFNGGVFASPLLQDRVVGAIQKWFANGDSEWTPHVLKNERHDLAVSRGAAYYGMVRRGQGVRIAAGLPRSYYLGIGTGETAELQAMCLLPAGMEPGAEVHIAEHPLELGVAMPVEFPLFHSSVRLIDPPGAVVPLEREQLTPLPPIRTVLRSRKDKEATTVAVTLHAKLTEIGTLQIWCGEKEGNRSWQLQFDVRSATQTDVCGHQAVGEAAGVVDEEEIAIAYEVLKQSFTRKGSEKPAGLPKRLSRSLELSKEQWPPSLLRKMWEMLMFLEPGRHKSLEHESRWLNLLGYSLRPGYGVALDDWRVMETWKSLRGKLAFGGPAVMAEWWILWRRISGGLPAGQQQALAAPLITSLKDEQRKSRTPRRSGKRRSEGNIHEKAEAWRMLGSLERLPISTKIEMGDHAVERLAEVGRNELEPALLWTIGRLGSRELLYGPLNAVVPADAAVRWLNLLMDNRHPSNERILAVMQLARRTGDRYRDLESDVRERTVAWLRSMNAHEKYVTVVTTVGELEDQTTAQVFGDSLPLGLRLQS